MIDVFIDTNILHNRNEQLDKALFVEKLKEIIGEIEINDIYTEIKILLPRMVLNELYQQQLEMFDDLNKRLENVSMPNMQYDRAFNYGEYLETIFKKAIMELKQGIVAVEVVDFPASDRLNSIISRAIKKEPPFEGKEKHSDKGFKDVLIWESIKEYKEKHINDETLIRHSITQALSENPAFLPLANNPRFQAMVDRLRANEEGK